MSVARKASASSASTTSTGHSTAGIGTSPDSRSRPQDSAAFGCSTANFSTRTPPAREICAINVCGVCPVNSTNSTCSLSQTSTARQARTGAQAGASNHCGAG